ncbi:MAG: type I-C CRISPR-associated protein Cas8c/Csd1 [bacterium]|jgi:CRISPR-associated protein Csd1
MILQALASYYERLEGSPTVAVTGYSREKIHFALVLDKDGNLLQLLDLREQKGKKLAPREIIVPQGVKKSVNIAANFLWGNTAYVLGADNKGKPGRTAECHKAFKQLHKELLGKSSDVGANAVLQFLEKWKPARASKLEYWDELQKGNLVFQLEGSLGFIHERKEIKTVWNAKSRSGKPEEHATCLVSGQYAPIARLHPAIKGVRDSQSSGAAIVSFNLDSFCSYGKSQNFNAPVSEEKTFAYTTALNHLLRFDSKNRIQIGDATTVFWTERDTPVEGFLGIVLDPRDTAGDDKELAVFLETIREGKFPGEYDPGIRFFILGLSPNASRLSIRFWHAGTVGDISQKLGQHFSDLRIVRSFDTDPEFPGMWHILRETCNRKSNDGPSPLLAGAIMKSILEGTLYPQALLSAVIGRIRAEQNINYLRASILKAVLTRKNRILNCIMEVPMALDKENKNIAYLLGRLFAVLEKAQQDAIPGANATIKDRFYGSASATPRAVFPQLLRLAQHHVQKAEYGRFRDKQIEEIMGEITEFPANMTLEQQGLFAIGYYQQRQEFYKKSNSAQSETNKEA